MTHLDTGAVLSHLCGRCRGLEVLVDPVDGAGKGLRHVAEAIEQIGVPATDGSCFGCFA